MSKDSYDLWVSLSRRMLFLFTACLNIGKLIPCIFWKTLGHHESSIDQYTGPRYKKFKPHLGEWFL